MSVDAGGTAYTDSAFISIGSAAAGPDIVSSGRSLVGTPGMLFGALALALGFAGVLAVALAGPNKSSADRRLDAYFGEGKSGKRKSDATADLKGSAVALADKVVSADLETRISQRLAGAGSALTASEWLLLHAGSPSGPPWPSSSSAVPGSPSSVSSWASSCPGSTSSSGTRVGSAASTASWRRPSA